MVFKSYREVFFLVKPKHLKHYAWKGKEKQLRTSMFPCHSAQAWFELIHNNKCQQFKTICCDKNIHRCFENVQVACVRAFDYNVLGPLCTGRERCSTTFQFVTNVIAITFCYFTRPHVDQWPRIFDPEYIIDSHTQQTHAIYLNNCFVYAIGKL